MFVFRRLYLWYQPKRIHSKVNGYDVYDLSVHRPTNITQAAATPDDEGQLDSSNSNTGGIRSALAGHKCANCRAQQKLSFREANIFETSFKNLSTGQLLKYGYEHLNITMRALEELKYKQDTRQGRATTNLQPTTISALHENGSSTPSIDQHEMIDERLQKIFAELTRVTDEFEELRNELMPATFGTPTLELDEADGGETDDFDDTASYLSSTTTTSLGYWDPEPNLHFFEIYQQAMQKLDEIPKPKMDRSVACGCDSYDDFLAKVSCLREAFTRILSNTEYRDHYIKIGESILRVAMENSFRVTICVRKRYNLGAVFAIYRVCFICGYYRFQLGRGRVHQRLLLPAGLCAERIECGDNRTRDERPKHCDGEFL